MAPSSDSRRRRAPAVDPWLRRRHLAARRMRPLPGHYGGCPAGLDPIRTCKCDRLEEAEAAGVRSPRRYR